MPEGETRAKACVMNSFVNVTFGMIVLNGEPFVRYNLRALYPFAHQIIVVEGAAPAAASIATPEGHSTDGTLDTLHDFKIKETVIQMASGLEKNTSKAKPTQFEPPAITSGKSMTTSSTGRMTCGPFWKC